MTTIRTSGQVVDSLTMLQDALTDEAIWMLTEDGLSCDLVDPINVRMLTVDIHGDLFEAYNYTFELDGKRIGVPLKHFRNFASYARVGNHGQTGDPVTINIDDETITTIIEREATRRSTLRQLDPDGLIQPEGLRDGVEYRWKCVVSGREAVRAFKDVAVKATDANEQISVGYRNGHLSLTGVGDEDYDDSFEFDGQADDDGPMFPVEAHTDEDTDRSTYEEQYGDVTSLFGGDLFKSVVETIYDAKMERMTLYWGEKIPLKVQFAHSSLGINGTYVLAPRLDD